jgi:predicted Zn-dependent protease
MEEVNAFALPGGHVTLLRGLLETAESPEEVAAVLAHEIGHVAHRDPTRLALRSAGSVGVLGLLLGDFAGGLVVLYLSEWLIQASYSRDAEAAADLYAHQMLASAGLPAEPMARFFQRLHDEYGDAEGLLSHLASHPDLTGRAAAARDADTVAGTGFVPVLTAGEWADLRAICD